MILLLTKIPSPNNAKPNASRLNQIFPKNFRSLSRFVLKKTLLKNVRKPKWTNEKRAEEKLMLKYSFGLEGEKEV